MILKVFEYTKDFSREYKYTLGQDMKCDALGLVRSIYRSNKHKNKTNDLEDFLDEFNLLVKAAAVGRRVQKIIIKFMPETIKQVPEIDMKVIKGLAKQHYFEKSKAIKQKVEA